MIAGLVITALVAVLWQMDRRVRTLTTAVQALVVVLVKREAFTVPMLLTCPICTRPHVDTGERATTPHLVHRCEYCQYEWQVARVPTIGVEKLPELRQP